MTMAFTHSEICGHYLGQQHISHLLPVIAWEHGWEALVEAMEAVWEISSQRTKSIALGGSGPYDLLLMPRQPLFQIFPNIDQGRRVGDFDAAGAADLIPLIGNNGCGPDQPEDLLEEFAWALALAKEIGRPVTIGGHCGLYEPLIKPDGSWLLLPEIPTRELVIFDQGKVDGRIEAILTRKPK